jgi:hypothetical protein
MTNVGIQAVTGTAAIQPALEALNFPCDLTAHPGAVRVDDIVLQDAVMALLAIELPQTGHKPNAAQYARASEAAQSGNAAESLVHLERAILDHPMYAEAAMTDPAFISMRGPLVQLVDRLTALAAFEAGSAILTATTLIAGQHGPPELIEHARTYLEAAQDHLRMGSYAESVEAVHSAFLAERFAGWSSFPVLKDLLRPVATAEYELAQKGDPTASLVYLEKAILEHPIHAATSTADPAFAGMRGAVLELVARLTAAARIETEAAMIGCPAGTMYSAVAQAHFELGTFSAMVHAGYIADLGKRVILQGSTIKSNKAQLIRLRRSVARLWRRWPLLAILLGWLLVGVVAGILSLPFQHGIVAEMRHLLFPVWGIGLLGMVVTGLVRSLLISAQAGRR